MKRPSLYLLAKSRAYAAPKNNTLRRGIITSFNTGHPFIMSEFQIPEENALLAKPKTGLRRVIVAAAALSLRRRPPALVLYASLFCCYLRHR